MVHAACNKWVHSQQAPLSSSLLLSDTVVSSAGFTTHGAAGEEQKSNDFVLKPGTWAQFYLILLYVDLVLMKSLREVR